MKKYHVLFIASWYPNKLNPQNGNFIRRHAEAVSEFSKVSVVKIIATKQKEKFLITFNKNKDVNEYICYYKKFTLKIPFLSYFVKVNRQLKAFKKTYKQIIKKEGKIDIVHVNVILPAGFFALYLKRKYNLPFVITEHWTKFQESSNSKFTFSEKFLIKKIGKKSSIICPVSENLKKTMINFGINGKYKVVPNVVNTEIFYPAKIKTKRSRIRLLHISHLDDKHKNISGILNVVKLLSDERKDFDITVSGERNLEQHKNYASKIEIPDNIISFEGEKTSEEVARTMRNHDIFVMFSNYENLPCVISEAHVCGVPVISSDVGGISEMIDETNGVLTEAGNEKDFKKKLSLMIDNINKYSSEEISVKAKKRYSYKSVGKKFFILYDEILNKNF